MLTAYLAQTRSLLQNPSAPTSLYSTADLSRWINLARGQLAGEAECIRKVCTISTVADTQAYDFSGLNTGVSATNGIQGIININQMF